MTSAGDKSETEIIKDTPFPTLTGELWGVFGEYFGRKILILSKSFNCIKSSMGLVQLLIYTKWEQLSTHKQNMSKNMMSINPLWPSDAI